MNTVSVNEYIFPLTDSRATLETVGGKGASLSRLILAGLPVPDGFHITTAAYRQFVEQNELQPRMLEILSAVDQAQPSTLESASQMIQQLFSQAQVPDEVGDAIEHAYAELHGVETPVAVRSSATAEDLPELSFAGQQETFLNIRGIQGVQDAVKRCWASLWTARAIGYRMQHKIDQEAVSLAVVVQELIPAEAAGILFTANPISGQRNEVVINAAWGLGEAIVGGKVTPDTYIADKLTGKVKQVEIAEKTVMTVQIQDGTAEWSVPAEKSKIQVLSDAQVADLVKLAGMVEKYYGVPQDIEWCWAKGKFHIVQSRPITKLAPEPIQWVLPNPKGQYMRGSAVDLMPDPLSPLFASMGIPGIISGVNRLARRLTRSEPVLPKDYFTTINGYAYGNVSFTPREWWWILTCLLPAYPRLQRIMVPFWRDEALPQYRAEIARRRDIVIESLTATELWREIQEIFDTTMYYLSTLLFSTMGASAGSEGLLTNIYNKMVKREGDPHATTLVMGYNSIPVRAEKSLYDLAKWCSENQELTTYFLSIPSKRLAAQLKDEAFPSGVNPEDWQGLRERFEEHLRQFGHLIYELDFAKPLPLDNPIPMLEACKMYLRGEGTNPYERQALSEEKRKQTTQMSLDRLKGLRRWIFRKALNWGQSMAEVREDALAEIGLGYPLLRQMLRELGLRFVAAEMIEQSDDIFWLEKEEIESGITRLESSQELEKLTRNVTYMSSVKQRKTFWRAAKLATPPPMLPPKDKLYGIKTDVFSAVSQDSQTSDEIKGVAASMGKVTAPACVLHGPEDFDQMKPGAVLVAGTTTPAWTPLFAMASAVVTDIGGPLSHGSIVAREYGIPAVMGTGVATKRIKDGQVITVDGNAGLVTLSIAPKGNQG